MTTRGRPGVPLGGPRLRQVLAVAATCALLVLLWWVGLGGEEASRPSRVDQGASSAPRDPPSGLPVVDVDDLPAQARETMVLIERGGPFPFERDGVTFRNAEGLLPSAPRGSYREYTVPTPGSGDRGARRLVAARAGPLYWTADHYASFALVRGTG